MRWNDLRWCFCVAIREKLSLEVAYRACFYITKLADTMNNTIHEFNRIFPSKYHVWGSPFAVHCFFLSMKIETRVLEAHKIDELLFDPHFHFLYKSLRERARPFVIHTELQMCTTLDWNLMPPCPFATLSVLRAKHAFDDRIYLAAAKACKEATIRAIDLNGKEMAYGAVVVAETGHDCELALTMRALTLSLVSDDSPSLNAILVAVDALSALTDAEPEQTHTKKRKLGRISSSPSSVIHERNC
jgi:hypothetical protein